MKEIEFKPKADRYLDIIMGVASGDKGYEDLREFVFQVTKSQ